MNASTYNLVLRGGALALLAATVGFTQPASPAPAAAAKSDDTIRLSEFTVQEQRRHEYRASNAISATRIDMPLMETPLSIQVITREFLEDTVPFGTDSGGANREAVSWLASADTKNVRGFNTLEFLRNGFLRYADFSAYNIDRIEVIKGPTAILDGITSPGGVINVITKKPNPRESFFRSRVLYGWPFDRRHGMVDFNSQAPVQSGGRPLLTYRFVGAYEYNQGPLDKKWGERDLAMLNPSFLLQPSENTDIVLEWEHYNLNNGDRGDRDQGRQLTLNDIPLAVGFGVPADFSWYGPDYSYREKLNDISFSFEHRFSRQFAVSLALNNHDRNRPWAFDPLFSVVNNAATGRPSVQRQWNKSERVFRVFGARLNAVYGFDALRAKHRLLFGYQPVRERGPGSSWQMFNLTNTARYSEFFDVADRNPNLAAPPTTQYVWRQIDKTDVDLEVDAFFAVHHGKWWQDRLVTLAGVYHTKIERSQTTINTVANTRTFSVYEGAITLPQLGIMYFVNPRIGIYANTSSSLLPNTNLRDGFENVFDPTRGESVDVGVKFTLLDERLLGSVSFYRIHEKDRIVNDPLAPNRDNPTADPNRPRGANVQVGEVVSEGIDFEANIYPVKNWSIQFGYAYNDGETTADAVAARVGQKLNGVFHHKVTVWNRYTFTEGFAKGLMIGGGFQWRGERVRTTRNNQTAYTDARVKLDLLAGYGWRAFDGKARYKVTFNAKNLLGQEEVSGFKPGTNDGYYFNSTPEYALAFEVGF